MSEIMLKRNSGFTLVELLIVVSIIGILTGVVIGVINPNKVRGRARDGVRKNDIAVIKGALENYYSENNIYPDDVPFGGTWSQYLKIVPQDPLVAKGFSYCYETPDSNNFVLCTQVEDENSSSVPNGVTPCGGIAAASAYCVQNPF